MGDKIRVFPVEDDLDFVFLLQKMIEQDSALEFLTYAENKIAGIEITKRINPDIVLMDLNLSGSELDGIEAAKEIRLTTNAKVLLLTSFEEPEIVINASKKSYASGYIFKSQFQALSDVIKQTVNSRMPQEQFIKELILSDLSPAERSVLNLMLGDGHDLKSTSKTIANQKTSIFKKLGLRNTNELLHLFRT